MMKYIIKSKSKCITFRGHKVIKNCETKKLRELETYTKL